MSGPSGTLENLAAWRRRLEALRDSTKPGRLRHEWELDIQRIVAAETEIARLQCQENWAIHQEQEIGQLRDQLQALGIEPVVRRGVHAQPLA